MLSSEMPSRIPIKKPFAQGGDRITIADADGNNMNYITGFPSVYGAPGSQGGKYLMRAELNALGNVATNDLFYHKCGGLNTFDPAFCEVIGGYPKGAVLDLVIDNQIYYVLSLVDNNKVDFRAGVDDVNWILLNYKEPSPIPRNVFFSIKKISAESTFVVGHRTAKASSTIGIYEGLDTTEDSKPEFSERYSSLNTLSIAQYKMYGAGIIIKDITDDGNTTLPSISLPNTNINNESVVDNGWKTVAGECGYVLWDNQAHVRISLLQPFEMSVVSGRSYVLAIWCGSKYTLLPDEQYPAERIFSLYGLKLSGALELTYDD